MKSIGVLELRVSGHVPGVMLEDALVGHETRFVHGGPSGSLLVEGSLGGLFAAASLASVFALLAALLRFTAVGVVGGAAAAFEAVADRRREQVLLFFCATAEENAATKHTDFAIEVLFDDGLGAARAAGTG